MAGLSEEEVCQTQASKEDEHPFGSGWFFPREQIEQRSPSRRDGISLIKENQLRKSYCVFLQDLGMRLKVCCLTWPSRIMTPRFDLRWRLPAFSERPFLGLSGHLKVHGGFNILV